MPGDAARLLAQEGLRHIEAAGSPSAGPPQRSDCRCAGPVLVHPRPTARLSDLFGTGWTDGTRVGKAGHDSETSFSP